MARRNGCTLRCWCPRPRNGGRPVRLVVRLPPGCRLSRSGSSVRRRRRKRWRNGRSASRRRFCRRPVRRGRRRCGRRAGCGCRGIRTPRPRWLGRIRSWQKAVWGRMGCSSGRTCIRVAVSSTTRGSSTPAGSSPPRTWCSRGSSDRASHRWRSRCIRGRCRSGAASTSPATPRANTPRSPKRWAGRRSCSATASTPA